MFFEIATFVVAVLAMILHFPPIHDRIVKSPTTMDDTLVDAVDKAGELLKK